MFVPLVLCVRVCACLFGFGLSAVPSAGEYGLANPCSSVLATVVMAAALNTRCALRVACLVPVSFPLPMSCSYSRRVEKHAGVTVQDLCTRAACAHIRNVQVQRCCTLSLCCAVAKLCMPCAALVRNVLVLRFLCMPKGSCCHAFLQACAGGHSQHMPACTLQTVRLTLLCSQCSLCAGACHDDGGVQPCSLCCSLCTVRVMCESWRPVLCCSVLGLGVLGLGQHAHAGSSGNLHATIHADMYCALCAGLGLCSTGHLHRSC